MSSISMPEHPWMLPASLRVDVDGEVRSGRVRRSTRDWIIDVAAFLLAIGGGALIRWGASKATTPGPMPPLELDVAIGVLSCLGLWLRRRWPVGLAVAMLPTAFLSITAVPAGAIALFTVAVHRRLQVLAVIAVLNLLAILPIFLLWPSQQGLWETVAWNVLGTLVIVLWGMFVRARRQLVLSLRERALRAEAEQQLRIEQAQRQERARIAREMHDVLAHRISLLSVHAGALEYRPDAPVEDVSRAAGIIRASAHQALQDLREVIGVLRKDSADDGPERPQPSLGDLPALIDESRQAGMKVSWTTALDDLADVPVGIGRNAYRIVQEALTNARKHAPGARVDLTVDGTVGRELTIAVRNPLSSARAARTDIPGAGSGLIGLAERASLAGGRLAHGRQGGDFVLSASLPWRV